MEYNEFKNIVLEDLKYINKEIKEESINKLYLFMNNLIEWNKNINLTAIKDEREIILKHFIDSIYISDLIKGKVLDIGSGAGFPGLPLKIIDENLELVSIDSVNKKINFQLDTIKKLELKNIEALHIRAEELAHDNKYREKFDIATSRAVANLATLSEYLLVLSLFDVKSKTNLSFPSLLGRFLPFTSTIIGYSLLLYKAQAIPE